MEGSPRLRLVHPAASAAGPRRIESEPAPARDDEALVRAVRAGDARARTALYWRVAPLLEGVLVRTLGPDHELADLLHDAFVRLLESLDALRDPRALPGWAVRIATRTALDRLRHRRRRRWLRFFAPEHVQEHEAAPIDEEGRQLLARVQRILDRLAPEDRVAFALRVIGELPLEEVADACECSLATVKRRVARAEARFVESAAGDPLLAEWVRDGARWGARS